jgi:death-on-curing protein
VREPRWVPRLVVEAGHLDQVREHGGLPGLRDEHALESALARARQKWAYDPEADLALLAAAYGFGIATSHPFNDGNKRPAFIALSVFLGLNGHRLVATEDEVVSTMLSLASGGLAEADLAAWVRRHIQPRPDTPERLDARR